MNDDKKFAQVSNESIQTWAETVGITDLSADVLQTLGADATYRLHQILNVCDKYLYQSSRRKLTSDDFNQALKLLDVPPVYGYNGNEAVEWVNIPELGIYIPHDPPVNLASTALSGDIFHQPGNTYVKGKWAHVSGHVIVKSEKNADEKNLTSLPLSPHLLQYHRTLFSVTTSPSVELFKTMCNDVGSSANIGPLIGSIIRSVLKGAEKASQKPLILRRLLLIIRALLFNPHIHLGPQNYIHDIVNVLVFSVVTERKNSQDTQLIRTLASNILLQLSRKEGEGGSAWELAVISLSGVVGSSTRPWTQHAGALTGLLPLGLNALYKAVMPTVSEYYLRLCHTLSNTPSAAISSAILAKDTLDANMTYGLLLASFVTMMVSLLNSFPYHQKLYVGKEVHSLSKASRQDEVKDSPGNADLMQKARHVYYLGEEMFGSAFTLQIPIVYLYCEQPVSSAHRCFPAPSETAKDNPTARPKLQKVSLCPSRFVQKRCSLTHAFDGYRPIIPVQQRKIYMCIRGCSTRMFNFLKQKKSLLPKVSSHPGRALLAQYNKDKLMGRMPHWTFIRPFVRSVRPCSSLNYLSL